MHGKKPTFWLDLTDDAPPRNYIEKALLMLRKEVVPRMFAHRKEQTIVGGEWWTQVRNGDETIDFHYDKDEAMASIQGVMKLPLVSTVTYLTDIGAPTLILNQTTIDGNAEARIATTFQPPLLPPDDFNLKPRREALGRFHQYSFQPNDRARYSLSCIYDLTCPVNFNDQLIDPDVDKQAVDPRTSETPPPLGRPIRFSRARALMFMLSICTSLPPRLDTCRYEHACDLAAERYHRYGARPRAVVREDVRR